MTNKILFVSKDASWQRYRNEILTELTARFDCEVDVITQSDIKDYIIPTNKLRYLKCLNIFKYIGSLSLFPYVYKFIVKEKPSVVLALPNSSNITELTLALFCKLTRTKLVYWTHGYDHCQRPNSGIRKHLERIRVAIINWCISKGDSIITFSAPGKQYLVEQGIKEHKIFVAPNTLNTEKLLASYLPVTNLQVEDFKTQYSLHNKTVYLFSGRLREGKRLNHFINALAKSKHKADVAIIVVGNGEMFDQWKSMSENADLNCHFLGEIFDETKLAVIFKSADWFIMPGYVGLAIVHAFSAGLPVLTEKISFHSPEINYLKDGVNGKMFDEFSIEQWTTFIDSEGLNAATKSRMSQEALKTVNNEASISNQLSSMAKALGVMANV
ncbi:glycosyltransferase family 4 protein [Pseudoalteromonas sp. APC 3213]|uniref:glycosyltransferase family 4 protein n=1 Tax=Pseudoalteromonas sp. APC 3213 TaxID=3035178 RepID=UPI0025B5B601|nr:glycosyltransferase family 4 protein [Pseudoalteromonas sp. APC 3213]MDN3401560.1 glycosyltransferase family 4 protein [Pseudoalteromonas sp. APC 3213]|tara:strand:- start:4584 stop:5735 length:1152 start_codon:yes stop_codon:yes gene_type:complete